MSGDRGGARRSSAELSRAMYEQLGADGLAARTTDAWDAATVRRVQTLLAPGSRVADLGCGYGRIAVPLAEAGHRVSGLDVTPRMLARARQRADQAGVTIHWRQGRLQKLPWEDGSFDAALCLWLTFNELYEPAEQRAAMREMCRVLRPGGCGLVDGPPFGESTAEADRSGEAQCGEQLPDDGISRRWRTPPDHAVAQVYGRLLAEAGAALWELLVDDCPGRPRYWLQFWTCSNARTS